MRACYECEAAGIELVLFMPEVTARAELMADKRYQVRDGDHVVGCKVFCPGCLCNTFIVLGGLNVEAASSVRFAYGNGKSIMPVSRCYICCNPNCPEVLKNMATSLTPSRYSCYAGT